MPPAPSTQKAGSSTHREHFVQFYERDDFLLDQVSGFLRPGLAAGEAGLVLATWHHRVELERRLRACRALPGPGSGEDRYIALDAATTLASFMVDGWPDERLFGEVVGGLVRRASRDGTRQVRAFGEMVALLSAEGKHDAALYLEELWNGLLDSSSCVSLLCAYPVGAFPGEEHGSAFLRICDTHAQVRPAESFTPAADPAELYRQVALLQQKAAVLEAEVARRRHSEEMLHRRERELSDFLENAAEGLHQVGGDQRIQWANRAEMEMLGYEPEEYIGHHIAEFHVDREVLDDILAKLQRGETLYDYPAKMRCRDGSIKHVLIHTNALIENGELVYTRCFTRDVTERVRLEAELQKKLEQLAELDRRKDEFLAMLGHELRNPLAAITSSVELMRLTSGDPRHLARGIEIVARQVALMSRLVDDLLDVSRITRGTIVLKTEEVRLDAIVERAIELVRPQIEERGHRLNVDLPAEPVLLRGDAARLVQVAGNLLSNAAKYTDPGGNIELSARRDGTELLLCVRDDGMGMPEELREKVFEPFVQAEDSLDRARGGLGIGLTLVRDLVRLHGGRVEAKSDGPGRGSEFVVCLPLPLAPGA